MVGSGTTPDIVAGLSRHKCAGIECRGGDLREGFDMTRRKLLGQYDFVWIHPPHWNIIRYSDEAGDPSNVEYYGEFRGLIMTCLKRCYDALEPGGRMPPFGCSKIAPPPFRQSNWVVLGAELPQGDDRRPPSIEEQTL